MRRRRVAGVLLWLGLWSAIYGVCPLLYSLEAVDLLPRWVAATLPYINGAIGYLTAQTHDTGSRGRRRMLD